jgi:hypothetical protein
MKQCSAQPKGHNLNINMYSFKEILELFKLSYDFDIDQLKQAKIMVLRMHPDKSRLPPDYFLFYKKAFDLIVEYYNEKQKVNVSVPHNEIKYESDTPDKAVYKQVGKTMKELGTEKFQEKFNQLFEKNMVKKRDESVNDWFKKNDPLFEFDDVKSTSGLGMAMDSIKAKSAALTQYKGVENMTSRMGNDLYEDDSNGYVSCDPFGKLKFDDLRKVHKDQTVFAVSERDFEKVQKYSSMDHLQRERGMANLTPIEKTHAEQMLAEKEAAIQKAMLAKKHADHLRSMEYAEKNKSVMSSFFQLTM